MKKFLLFVPLVAFQIYAAETPTIVRETEANLTRVRLAPRELPEIKIQECMGCGKDASQKCSTCKLTFYCSQDCQKGHTGNHKTGCKQLARAHQGDIETMRRAFGAYIAKAMKSSDKQFVDPALAWHLRTIVRLRQDMACSKDRSTQASIGHVQMEHGQLLLALAGQKVCTQEELESREALKGAVAWVRQITEEDQLVDPFGIRRYGMKVFINPELNKDEEFVPEDEWREKRLGVLETYEQALQEQEQ